MAQPIHCDYAGEVHPADVLVSRLDNGETLGWCDVHYLEVCRAILDAVDEAERAATDATALAALGVADAPDAGAWEGGVLTADPEGTQGPAEPGFPTSGGSSPAADPPAAPPTKPAGGRKRSAPHSGATQGPNAPEGPDSAAVGHPDEAGAVPR